MYNLMPPIREELAGSNEADSLSNSKKGVKVGLSHKKETYKQSVVRESGAGSQTGMRNAILSSADGASDKVSWQKPPMIKETIIEANLDDESGDRIRVKGTKVKKRKAHKKKKIEVEDESPGVKDGRGTPKFKIDTEAAKELAEQPVTIEEEKDEGCHRDLAVKSWFVLRGVRKEGYEEIVRQGFTDSDVGELNYNVGFQLEPIAPITPITAIAPTGPTGPTGPSGPTALPDTSEGAAQVEARNSVRFTEPAPARRREPQAPFR